VFLTFIRGSDASKALSPPPLRGHRRLTSAILSKTQYKRPSDNKHTIYAHQRSSYCENFFRTAAPDSRKLLILQGLPHIRKPVPAASPPPSEAAGR